MNAQHKESNVVRVDNYTRVCLTLIAVLLTVMVVGLWADHTPDTEQAQAAQPFVNASAQRLAMVKQQQVTNEKLDKLVSLLQSGDLVVNVEQQEPASKGSSNEAPKEEKQ
ncbi:MAG: hypothetical protein ACLFVU_11610 [Phycisphaerae bacterium]